MLDNIVIQIYLGSKRKNIVCLPLSHTIYKLNDDPAHNHD